MDNSKQNKQRAPNISKNTPTSSLTNMGVMVLAAAISKTVRATPFDRYLINDMELINIPPAIDMSPLAIARGVISMMS